MVAPFFGSTGADLWIDDFIENPEWVFNKIPFTATGDDWHSRTRRETGLSKWLQYWDQSGRAFPASGIITVFPQPAFMTAVRKNLRRSDVPLLAWCFNLGQYPTGLKRSAARFAFRKTDRFVVHSRSEVQKVSEFLDIPSDRVNFVPLQRAPISIEATEDISAPFVVAMGSANRDYETFFRAAEIAALPCKVVASRRSLEGLRVPANVSVEHNLTASQCHQIVQRSRFSVVPLLNTEIASGQVTVVESMRMNKAVIATSSIGTVDYIEHGHTGALVPAHDPQALATAMLQLWDDADQRNKFIRNAGAFAAKALSDEAAAVSLARIISELELER